MSLAAAFVLAACSQEEKAPVVLSPEPTVDALVDSVLGGEKVFTAVPFATVLESATGKRILPFNPDGSPDAEILEAIRTAMTKTLAEFNKPDSVTNTEERINEASAHFEEAILRHLDEQPGISCDYPRTAEGNLQRAGYPDLRLVHEATGRVAYLDPKLVEAGSLASSLRTFYFTPRTQTNKVLDDAHHLLVGIEHDGHTGRWRFLRWHLVDLAAFRVTLKAEFQGSNRDLYRPELLIETREP